jgi:hypothetical protein
MPGQRTRSRITLTIDIAHDGDPRVLGEHLALELEAIVDRSDRIDVVDGPRADAEVIQPGDELSARSSAGPQWVLSRTRNDEERREPVSRKTAGQRYFSAENRRSADPHRLKVPNWPSDHEALEKARSGARGPLR